MCKSLDSDVIRYLDEFNKDFEEQYGYIFCRCYSCFLPILLDVYIKNKSQEVLVAKISNAIQSINDDYLYSADFKMDVRFASGLRCGYDCIHYEDNIEACPVTFWEIEKSNLHFLLEMLDKISGLNG